MKLPESTQFLTFKTPLELNEWLKLNHATEVELWIKVYKKQAGAPSVTWDDIVVESLCWGWIDGIKKSLNEQAYLQRVTPRKARSSWSKKNRDHAERLISEGRMMPAGLKQVHAAQSDGRWENAYTASEMEVPTDFILALESEPKAKAFFESLTKTNRYIIANGLISAKRADTRNRRFEKFMDMLINQQKPT